MTRQAEDRRRRRRLVFVLRLRRPQPRKCSDEKLARFTLYGGPRRLTRL